MYVNFDINSLVLELRASSALMKLLHGWLTADKPYYEIDEIPYCYVEENALPVSNIISRRHIVSFTIVLWKDGIDREFKTVLSMLDNTILPDTEWCLPIKKIGDVVVTNVSKWFATQKVRFTDKGNLAMRQDYYFDVVIVE